MRATCTSPSRSSRQREDAGAGMPAPRPAGFTTDRAFAYLCLAFLALVLFVLRVLNGDKEKR